MIHLDNLIDLLDGPLFILASSFVISGLEAVHCYFITNNLVGNKVNQAFKIFSIKDAILVAFHAAFSLITLYFFSSQYAQALPNAWQLAILGVLVGITTIILFMVVTHVVKTKNSSTTVDEVVLIFFIFFILNLIISALALMPVVGTIEFLIDRYLRLIFLCTSYIIFTMLFLWILDKIDLNKLFVFVAHRLALKILIFAVSLISLLAIFFILIFSIEDFTDIRSIQTIQIITSFGILLILLIIGLVRTLKSAHQYEVVVPERYHDMKRILTLLNLKAEDTQTVDELKDVITSTIELMDIKTAKPESQKADDEPEDFEAFIKKAIDALKLNHKSTVEITTSIQYFEPHKNVTAMDISVLLGTLLENAIETGTEYPILVDILSTEHVLFIKVANEAEPKDPQELYNMLSKGYSTKEKVGRGFGLAKLKKRVENHQGNIIITQEMNPTMQANYITFTLNF